MGLLLPTDSALSVDDLQEGAGQDPAGEETFENLSGSAGPRLGACDELMRGSVTLMNLADSALKSTPKPGGSYARRGPE
jgi:hypothetical protein